MFGTSGWYYDEWVGPFYDTKKGMFTHYSKVFNTTEVNSTFYRYPTSRMVYGWYRTAPPGFIFALKLPQIITHDKWLSLDEGVEDDTERFLELVKPLAEKLGPILIQLRPKFNYDDHVENLERYLETLPRNYEWAVEFRHLSWMRPETYEILEKQGVAYTIVDEPLLPPEVHVTSDFAYIRWHGHGARPWYNYEYGLGELEAWIPKVEETSGKAAKVYGYFNNHFSANAVKNAVEMLNLLNLANEKQTAVLERVVEHRKQGSRPRGVQPLEAFAVEEEGLSVADFLIRFTSNSRLARAEKIDDSELSVTMNSEDCVKAGIRRYSIEIDARTRVIKHDCDDWRKGVDQKRVCKHVAKLFLSLPSKQALRILTDMWEHKESWQFEAL